MAGKLAACKSIIIKRMNWGKGYEDEDDLLRLSSDEGRQRLGKAIYFTEQVAFPRLLP